MRLATAARIGLVALLLAGCAAPRVGVERPAAPPTSTATLPLPAPTDTARPTPPPAKKPVLKRGGGFYKDDGPADEIPVDLDAVPDAEPKVEPLHKGALKPYVVLGKSYVPNTSVRPYRARGIASWYGRKFHGQKTSIGEPYDMFAMTAAHTTLALPSYVRVSNPENGRTVIVRLTDRGPFHQDRIIDLSYTAAHKLGLVGNGSGLVEVEAILPEEYEGIAAAAAAAARPATAQPVAARPATPLPPPAASLPEAPADKAGEDELGDFLARLDKPGTAAAPAAAAKGTWLQLGAFGNPDNAEALRAHLGRELDWLAEPIRIHVAGGIQRVQVGPYRSRAEAEKVAERIRAEMGTKPGFVVR